MGGVIGYVGMSHLGIVSSVAAAAKGFAVVAHDPDTERCTALAAGHLPVHEPGLAELLTEHRQRLTFTADAAALRRCRVVVIAADVPTDDQGNSDLAVIDLLTAAVVPVLAPGAVLVVLSQVRPGYVRQLRARLEAQGLTRLDLLYQVETLVFGNAVERALRPERFIVGCAAPTEPLPAAYAELLAAFACPVLRLRYESAELAKTAINLFLVASVTAANTLAELCAALGADWSEIKPTLRLDRRIGPHAYLDAGLGLSGGNLERDLQTLRSLTREFGTEASLIDSCVQDSTYRRGWPLRQLHGLLPASAEQPVVAVWGLAYKAHTRSTKNAPAVALIQHLCGLPGRCTVRVYDPEAEPPAAQPDVIVCRSPLEACQDADALVVMTPWPEFAAVPLSEVRQRMRGRFVIDPWHCLPQDATTDMVQARLGVANDRKIA